MWTGMGEFNSVDHCFYYCGQESLRRNGVSMIVNKRVRNTVLWCIFKNDRMISVRFQGKQFNITIIQVYATAGSAEEAEVERFYEDLQDLLELTPPKDVLFIISSVQFSCSVVSDSLRPHESQHARPPCPSPTPGVVSDAIQPSYPLSSPSPPAPSPSQHQSLLQWVNSSHEVDKVLEFQLYSNIKKGKFKK